MIETKDQAQVVFICSIFCTLLTLVLCAFVLPRGLVQALGVVALIVLVIALIALILLAISSWYEGLESVDDDDEEVRL